METLLILAITMGMRRGELAALRWKDINFDEHYLQVRRSVRRVAKYGVVVSEPKTPSSRRKIELSPFLIEILSQHRATQQEMRLAADSAWRENDLVFCNKQGEYINFGYLGTRLRRILRKVGLPPMRFHDLRHSAATLLLAMGIHPKVVQELLGHSTIAITLNIYSHVLPSMQQEAMHKMSNLFDTRDGRENDSVL